MTKPKAPPDLPEWSDPVNGWHYRIEPYSSHGGYVRGLPPGLSVDVTAYDGHVTYYAGAGFDPTDDQSNSMAVKEIMGYLKTWHHERLFREEAVDWRSKYEALREELSRWVG